MIGRIYTNGAPARVGQVNGRSPSGKRSLCQEIAPLESAIGVPVAVGDSICGVLRLGNRRSGGPYSARDEELLRIFAAYMSSSIQNALDALRARALARLDHLTGLLNGRFFQTRLQEEMARADERDEELCLFFLDLDHFKQVNDTCGHDAGSLDVAGDCPPHDRKRTPGDGVARYGGDEFVALLPPRVWPTGQVAETFRHVIGAATMFRPNLELTFDGGEQLPRVTVSIGVASYRDHLPPVGNARQREDLFLRLADTAMYRAKSQGRDRVEVAEPED